MNPSDMDALDAYWFGRINGLVMWAEKGVVFNFLDKEVIRREFGLDRPDLSDLDLATLAARQFKSDVIARRLTK